MNKNGKWIVIFLLVCIMTPLSNDVYIASLPAMAQQFLSPNVKYLVSIFMVGLSVGQLIIGPLSDRFGRKLILIGCLTIYCIATLGIVLAPYLSIILGFRLVQALVCSAMIPGALSIAKDSFKHEQLISVVPLILGVVTTIPVVAPMLGGVLQVYFNWQASFILLLAVALFFLLIFSVGFTESMQEKNKHATKPFQIAKNYWMLMSHRQYLSYALTGATSYAILFAYIAASPFIFINQLHISVAHFPLLFALSAVILALESFLLPVLAKKVSPIMWLKVAGVFLVVGSLSLLGVNLLLQPSVLSVVLPMVLVSMGVGLIRPSAATLCMQVFPAKFAGVSSASFNFISFLLGGVSTAIMALIPVSVLSYAIVVSVFALLNLLVGRLATRQPASSQAVNCAT